MLWRIRWTLIIIVVALAAARLALPFAVEHYVNGQLNKSKDFSGHIGNVHIQLYRGRYRIDNAGIFKRSGEIKDPLFAADQIFLSIQWEELFHGSVVGKIIMVHPRVNFVSGPTEAQSQSGKDESWNKILESLFPFNLNRLDIENGEIHFQNEYSKPPVDIALTKLSATATNLNNSRQIQNLLPAGITAKATTIGGGSLDMQVQLNPMDNAPTYQLVAQLTNVDLTALNSFLKAYGKFDVASGKFALFTSIASKDGSYDGYFKVFFDKLKVFAWEKDKRKDALEIFWQAVVGTVTTILKNHPKDSLATRIPISGSYGNTKVGTWTAVAEILRNGFIRALVPKVDEKETVQKVEEKNAEKKIEKVETPGPSSENKAAEKMARPAG